jgi:GlpG protein
MRLIGYLPEKSNALTFSDFLYVQGIGNNVDAEKEGWAIWVHGEDEVPRATELLSQFKTNPADPKYKEQAREASQLKEQELTEEAKTKNRQFDRTKLFQQARPYGMGPLTIALVLTCIAVALFSKLGTNREVLGPFYITHFVIDDSMIKWIPGLPEIRHGEIWRLITPIFLHFGAAHLIFNMLAMLDLGSMVEARKGAGQLAILVLVIGVVSNLAQYSFAVPQLDLNTWAFHFRRGAPNFGGISGVAYGLLGYIWMKSRFDPGSGFFLHRQAVTMMLVWFVLCLVGVIPGIANTAHAAGLFLGVIWGYLSSRRANGRTG